MHQHQRTEMFLSYDKIYEKQKQLELSIEIYQMLFWKTKNGLLRMLKVITTKQSQNIDIKKESTFDWCFL